MNKALLRQGNKYSLDFDGINDYVDCGGSAILHGMDDLSISIWVYPLSKSGTVFRGIIGKMGIAGQRAYEMHIRSDYIRFDTNDGVRVDTTDIKINEWQHIVVTRKRNGLQKLFLNSIEKDSIAVPNNAIVSSTRNLGVGAYDIGSGFTRFFEGYLDKVRLYRRELSLNEIKMLYRGIEPSTVDLELSYDFKEGTGTSTKDLSGNNNNGTLENGVAWSTDVPTWGGV